MTQYTVRTNKAPVTTRLIEAPSSTAALAFVASADYNVSTVTLKDLPALLQSGVKPEVVPKKSSGRGRPPTKR